MSPNECQADAGGNYFGCRIASRLDALQPRILSIFWPAIATFAASTYGGARRGVETVANINKNLRSMRIGPALSPGSGAASRVGSKKLAGLPMSATLGVFIPIGLTALVSVPLRPYTQSLDAHFPMFPFLIYTACNWLVIGIGAILLKRRGVTWSGIGFANFRWSDLLYAVIAAVIGIFVVYPVAKLLSGSLGLKAMGGMSYSLPRPLDVLSAILLPVLLAPLAEDIIFRGFLLTLLRQKIQNLWLVGFLGTLPFALIHVPYFGWAGTIFIFLWAPLLVWLFLWRQSIYPPYVMHVLNNLFAYVAVPLFFR